MSEKELKQTLLDDPLNNITLAIDVMGGDGGPQTTIEGVSILQSYIQRSNSNFMVIKLNQLNL